MNLEAARGRALRMGTGAKRHGDEDATSPEPAVSCLTHGRTIALETIRRL
jgi:hypothetical protein